MSRLQSKIAMNSEHRLTEKQIELLKEYRNVLNKLDEEATMNDDFNNALADLGIFNMSIDEMSAELSDAISTLDFFKL